MHFQKVSISLLSILSIPASTSATPNHVTTLSTPHQNITSSPLKPPLTNNTYRPLTFLGVECYHLQPNTVTQQDCEPTFAQILEYGDSNNVIQWWNGWPFRDRPSTPCTITVSSRVKDNQHLKIGIATKDLFGMVIEVLQTCSTGGANTFNGDWEVRVTRWPMKRGEDPLWPDRSVGAAGVLNLD